MAENFDVTIGGFDGEDDPSTIEVQKSADDESRIRFAEALKYYLAKFDKTQRDIANHLGVSEPTVSQWCSGMKMPRPPRIKRLADYFGISFNDMMALPASEDFADFEEPGSGIVEEIDSLSRKVERAKRPLIYGGKEISDEETEVLAAVIKLIRTNKSDRRKPSE